MFSSKAAPAFGRRLFLIGILGSGLGSLFFLLKGLASFLGAALPQAEPDRIGLGAWEGLKQNESGPVYRSGVWLVRDERGWYGLVNTCTHLGCHPSLDSARGELACPCHGSRFNLKGQVLKGPADRPLNRPYLWKGTDGQLWADLRQPVGDLFRVRS